MPVTIEGQNLPTEVGYVAELQSGQDPGVDDDHADELPRCSAVVRLVGHTGKFSKTKLDAAYGREINITLSGNSSGGHSCSQYTNCTHPQLETSVALCCVTKLDILEWPFIVPTQGALV